MKHSHVLCCVIHAICLLIILLCWVTGSPNLFVKTFLVLCGWSIQYASWTFSCVMWYSLSNMSIEHSPMSCERLIQYDYYIFSYVMCQIYQICLLSFWLCMYWIHQICLLNVVWAKYRISIYQNWCYIQQPPGLQETIEVRCSESTQCCNNIAGFKNAGQALPGR